MSLSRRKLVLAIAAAAFAGPAACGKRGDPKPPEGRPAPHPRTYPAPSKTTVIRE